MRIRFVLSMVGLVATALICPLSASAQNSSTPTWPQPVPNRPLPVEKDRKPAPRRSLEGFTPYGLELYKTHKPLEGADAVSPAQTNDPRVRCEPLGVVRHNHYDLGVQIFQDEDKLAMLYQYDNRWRIIWTDGRPLPKLLDGGVEVDGQYRDRDSSGTPSAGGSTITRSRSRRSGPCRRRYCSPSEIESYNELYGNAVSGK